MPNLNNVPNLPCDGWTNKDARRAMRIVDSAYGPETRLDRAVRLSPYGNTYLALPASTSIVMLLGFAAAILSATFEPTWSTLEFRTTAAAIYGAAIAATLAPWPIIALLLRRDLRRGHGPALHAVRRQYALGQVLDRVRYIPATPNDELADLSTTVPTVGPVRSLSDWSMNVANERAHYFRRRRA